MTCKTVFKRYELKYMLNQNQKQALLKVMSPYMKLDAYGHSSIRNIYFDTSSFMLIRHSIEKPLYKEKLRIRSYGPVSENDDVFVELKKKYNSVVYKRRLILSEREAMNWICNSRHKNTSCQIAREINYFCDYYKDLHPCVYLSYEREAYYDIGGSDLRITFDNNILYRTEDLSLIKEPAGIPLTGENQILMEIKTSGGIPLWMTRFLTEEKIYKQSFSKYGAAYQHMTANQIQGGLLYA